MFSAEQARFPKVAFEGGWWTLLLAVGALAIPTIIRAAVDGVVTGCEFTPYLPFVFICAFLMRWWQASAVALTSVAILGGLFGGSRAFMLPCFTSAAGIFLGASAMMIGIAVLVRSYLAQGNRQPDHLASGVVFSLDRGEVWASWNGHDAPVRLGSRRKVSEMMEDFLAQENDRHSSPNL